MKNIKYIKLSLILVIILLFTACTKTETETDINSDTKIEISMAYTYKYSDLSFLVSAFNEQSEDYKISLVYYDPLTYKDILVTEIIAGTAPDVFAFYTEFIESANGSGAYENLIPYLEEDEYYNSEIFIESIYNSLIEVGGLYYLPYCFSLKTFIVEDENISNLTMDEAIKLAEDRELSLFPTWLSQTALLSNSMSFIMQNFIDWDKMESNFSSVDFIELIEEISKHDNAEDNFENSLLNQQILNYDDMIYIVKRNYGENYSYIGFPTETGGASDLSIGLRFYMNSTSDNKEAVWEFLRFALSDEGQSYVDGFPVTQSAMEILLDELLKESETKILNNSCYSAQSVV